MLPRIIVLLASSAIVLLAFGCGPTVEDRKRISKDTEELASVILQHPHSSKGKKALDELIELLNGEWRFGRCEACEALGKVGAYAVPAVPHLIQAAKCGDPFVEQSAMQALSVIGPSAAAAVGLFEDTLKTALSDPAANSSMRTRYAVRGLGNIGAAGFRAIPLLERASKFKDEALARESLKTLTKLGSVGPNAAEIQ